ncbi:hypothetical protein Aple_097280 [Acrocarpospora pleiomorpha]|uniref:Uncharacterized protein n=1 Tax=Acrocarpospora pleiomorpha TaxID=90975 RepID=A0A5M3Y3D1_9ACTN|nr:tetratricopeptide repeat protein [Acrocarpospora pleiomorpha]GES26829.1 hypothetical protein Aple_097280 [Acrocarpospora pleiomorpha]
MLVSERLRQAPGMAIYRGSVPHESCAGRFVFDSFYYVDLDEWPDFRRTLDEDRLGKIQCDTCGDIAEVKFPVIVEIASRNLLIFATHGGDDGGVESGFVAVLDRAAAMLTSVVAERARRRPYTFVHGYRGLRVLLDALDGVPLPKPAPPYAHAPDTGRHFSTLHGYRYGDLFFHYPGQRTVDDLVCALLHWSAGVTDAAEMKKIVAVAEGILRIIGPHHPWLVHELGRLYLELGEFDEAQRLLELASSAQHCWLAVTASILDATPATRADVESQSAELPHATPATVRSDVCSVRHTVTRQRPAYKDYAFWHFPEMEQNAHPSGYTTQTVHEARGLAVGYLSRYFIDESRSVFPSFSIAFGNVLTGTKENIEAVADAEPEAVRGFWWHYVLARWLGHTNEHDSLVQEIDTAIADLAAEADLERFYLEGAARELRG